MRTGDLAARTGLTTKTIRFHGDSGLLPAPPRTPGGYRGCPDHTVTRFSFVRDAGARASHSPRSARSSPSATTAMHPEPTSPN
ncbi:MerR family DNA-binding transcriptional regulator [Streptomyces sp. GDS52]|uniref:MerR family DNA-binding transcriptional regulator n=1 Tax=unclassified Streptomyces TaxID=2593676 RepID=UPI00365CB4E6